MRAIIDLMRALIQLRKVAPELFRTTVQDAIITISWFYIDPIGEDVLHMSY
jgi:hypothetical protein